MGSVKDPEIVVVVVSKDTRSPGISTKTRSKGVEELPLLLKLN